MSVFHLMRFVIRMLLGVMLFMTSDISLIRLNIISINNTPCNKSAMVYQSDSLSLPIRIIIIT